LFALGQLSRGRGSAIFAYPIHPHENEPMLPDDVFRERLEKTLIELETWAGETRGSADITITASDRYWRMVVRPFFPGACPFELLIKANQTFDLVLDHETYEDKPIQRFDLFLILAKAIAEGRVERIETRNALTGILTNVAMRVELAPGWDWIGSRTVLKRFIRPLEADEEQSTYRFLPYNR
jgi:hypothetical protein